MNLILPNIFFVILIGILTSYLTFITTKGGLTDDRIKGIWKRLTSRGKKVFFVLLTIFLVLVSQEHNNTNSSNLKDSLLKYEQKQRDSIVEHKIAYVTDSINKKYYQEIAIAFSKQELKLDTLNRTIVKIKNNSPTNNYQQTSPVLFLDSTAISLKGKTGRLSEYSLKINMRDAGATNFKIDCKMLTKYTNNSYSLTSINFFTKNSKMSKNSIWKLGFSSLNLRNELKTRSIYLYFTGTYTTIDGLKTCSINNVYEYNIANDKVSRPTEHNRKGIMNIIDKLPNNGEIIKI